MGSASGTTGDAQVADSADDVDFCKILFADGNCARVSCRNNSKPPKDSLQLGSSWHTPTTSGESPDLPGRLRVPSVHSELDERRCRVAHGSSHHDAPEKVQTSFDFRGGGYALVVKSFRLKRMLLETVRATGLLKKRRTSSAERILTANSSKPTGHEVDFVVPSE